MKPSKPNKLDRPYYGGMDDPYACIHVIEAWDLNFALGNVLKYVKRMGMKHKDGGLEDLQKARWYLDREIKRLGGKDA